MPRAMKCRWINTVHQIIQGKENVNESCKENNSQKKAGCKKETRNRKEENNCEKDRQKETGKKAGKKGDVCEEAGCEEKE
jgi:hypothetical protein